MVTEKMKLHINLRKPKIHNLSTVKSSKNNIAWEQKKLSCKQHFKLLQPLAPPTSCPSDLLPLRYTWAQTSFLGGGGTDRPVQGGGGVGNRPSGGGDGLTSKSSAIADSDFYPPKPDFFPKKHDFLLKTDFFSSPPNKAYFGRCFM